LLSFFVGLGRKTCAVNITHILGQTAIDITRSHSEIHIIALLNK
jgi:hypothetical protein